VAIGFGFGDPLNLRSGLAAPLPTNMRFLHPRTHRASFLKAIVLACPLFLSGSPALAQTPGSLDTSFIKGAGADGFIRVVAVQPDAKILAGGNFGSVHGANNTLVTRLNSDGSPDTSFASAFLPPILASRVYTLALQPDGRILAAGTFTSVGGTFRTNVARLQADGSLDPSFDPGAGPAGLVRILAIQTDTRILIGGEFTTVNNTNRNRIARLNADGSLDTTFDPGTGADNIVRSIALLPSGQLLVGGLFTSFDGQASKYLVRLNANGSLDTSFPAGGGPNGDVYFVAPQPEGTILIGGDFTAVNGTNLNRIARLLADGSVDPSFIPQGGVVGGPVYNIIRQPSDKIALAGAFTTVNTVPRNRLARLNPDGSLDSAFDPGSGPSDTVLTLAIQTDGKLVAGGLFATYDGTTVGMLARVNGDSIYPALAAELPDPEHILVSWPSWATNYALQTKAQLQLATWQTITNKAGIRGDQLAITLPLAAQSQFYRLISQ